MDPGWTAIGEEPLYDYPESRDSGHEVDSEVDLEGCSAKDCRDEWEKGLERARQSDCSGCRFYHEDERVAAAEG